MLRFLDPLPVWTWSTLIFLFAFQLDCVPVLSPPSLGAEKINNGPQQICRGEKVSGRQQFENIMRILEICNELCFFPVPIASNFPSRC